MSRFWRKTTTTNTLKNTPLTLSNAMICMDYEHIFSAYNPLGTCPKCSSQAVILISRGFRPGRSSPCRRWHNGKIYQVYLDNQHLI